jgi:hypothetical protein
LLPVHRPILVVMAQKAQVDIVSGPFRLDKIAPAP